MIEMNPYYARRSPVGDVFDVATFSPRKAMILAVFGDLLGTACLVAAIHLYNPTLLPLPKAPWISEINTAILQAGKSHPLAVNLGVAGLGLFALICMAASVASIVDAVHPNYYFRAGPGGFSVRVPNGVALKKFGCASDVLQLDLRWAELENWTLVQEKQFGSLSRHQGNLSAYVKLKTIDGKKYAFCLNGFQESGELIWSKLQNAREMVSARLDQEPNDSTNTPARQTLRAVTRQEKQQAVSTALTKLLAQTDPSAGVVFSDAASGKFLQFVCNDGSLLLDLPEQTLDEAASLRAAEYFSRLGLDLQEYDLLDQPGGTAVATQRAFQLQLANQRDLATQLALDLFTNVFHLPADFALAVEEV